jgi:hypothetical protein
MDEKSALELIESVFTFDYVGDSMMKVRKNLDDEEMQNALAQELKAAAIEKNGETSAEDAAAIAKAAEERVKMYVKSSKSSKGTGCG